jgi:hypothetical protein
MKPKSTLLLKIFAAIFVVLSISLMVYTFLTSNKENDLGLTGECQVVIIPVKYIKMDFRSSSDLFGYVVEVFNEKDQTQVKVIKKGITERILTLDEEGSKQFFDRLGAYFCNVKKIKSKSNSNGEDNYDMFIESLGVNNFNVSNKGTLIINSEDYSDKKIDSSYHPDVIFSEFVR